ncbi:MAG: hypothetical protein Q9219_001313 [cf. Caloplaca sp. 3 TL-2023]
MARKNGHLHIPSRSLGHSKAVPLITPSATVLVESPFFLQPADDVSPESKLQQISEEKPDGSFTFPLPKLPAELQLRVLWHCIVSSLPILNAGIPKEDQAALLENETRGQRRINPAIMFTCKAYYYEGIKLLYANNHFSYTCERLPSTWPNGAGKGLARIEKLVLRSLCNTDSLFTYKAAIIPMYWLRYFRHVKTLRIDFCGTLLGYRYRWDEDHDSMSLLVETLDNMIVERMHNHLSTKLLSELILTGLPESDIGLFVLKSMSMLVQARGRIGIGTGPEGKSYRIAEHDYVFDEDPMAMFLRDDRPFMNQVEPCIHWIRVEDVPTLIANAASEPHSRWLSGNLGLVSERLGCNGS